jgi:hypothetical protein
MSQQVNQEMTRHSRKSLPPHFVRENILLFVDIYENYTLNEITEWFSNLRNLTTGLNIYATSLIQLYTGGHDAEYFLR